MFRADVCVSVRYFTVVQPRPSNYLLGKKFGKRIMVGSKLWIMMMICLYLILFLKFIFRERG